MGKVIGVIGGSGVYQVKESNQAQEIDVETPFGSPSGTFLREKIGENVLVFLPRHGVGHQISPSEINYRANVYGFKSLGAEVLVSVSAVGSLRENIEPGDFVLPDQYIDLTRTQRERTFFGDGVVGHAHFADPSCATLREFLQPHLESLDVKTHVGGVYVCMEGPQFSTRAESHWYRSWQLPEPGVSVIGMTAMPEARLAREAGLCYQTVAMATDYDCWRDSAEHDVSVEDILKVLRANGENFKSLVAKICSSELPSCQAGCRQSMEHAVITAQEKWPQATRDKLATILK